LATKSGNRYLPDRGDVIWLSFDPQAGHEQAGRRPAIVLSPSLYNRSSVLALVVPVTSQIKGYPFEVAIPAGLPVTGVILADHIKSVDWAARKAEFRCKLPTETVGEVLAKAALLLTAS
jgi:mRNA interferase MazF